jgi:L-asparaginase
LLPVSSDYLGLPDDLESTRVPLLWITPGIDGVALDSLAAGADGVVIAGTGGGHVPADVAAATARLAETGTPVVIASRTGAGPLLSATYGGTGSEVDLREIGAISAGSLHPTKARLRLMVALALGLQPEGAFGSAGANARIETRAR